MNFFRCIIIFSFVMLQGCLSVPDTVIPAPTFYQYSTNPVFLESVLFDKTRLEKPKNDMTSKLRAGFQSYYHQRFQEGDTHKNSIYLMLEKLVVSEDYIQVGGKNDVLSSWKSFDQYSFYSLLNVKFICSNTGVENIKTLEISKKVKVPIKYSLYKKELYLLSSLERYIEGVDKEILPYINSQQASCR